MAKRKRAVTKTAKRSGTRARRPVSGGPVPSVAARLPKPSAAKVAAAKRRFERGVLERGEAAPKGKPLPPGATHEITGRDAHGRRVLKRRRFSAR